MCNSWKYYILSKYIHWSTCWALGLQRWTRHRGKRLRERFDIVITGNQGVNENNILELFRMTKSLKQPEEILLKKKKKKINLSKNRELGGILACLTSHPLF